MEVEYTLNASSNQAVIKTNKCKLTPSSPLEAIDGGGALTKYIMTGDSMFRSRENDNIFELHLTLKTTSSNSSLVDCSAKSTNGGFFFRNRLFHKATSDVDIVVEGTRIPAHKLILSLASPVFTAMFENQMQESVSNQIVISDFSEEVVRSMLRCIYDGSVVEKEMEKHADQLLLIANKYELTEIESAATKHIISTITIDNAITVLLSADKFDRSKIKSAAMNFIVANADHFFSMSDFAGRVGNVLTNEILGYMGCMLANKRVKY